MARRLTTEEIERLLQQTGRDLASLPPHGPSCLTDEEFVRFCRKRLTAQEHEKVVRHLEGCERCLAEVSLYLTEMRQEDAEGPPLSIPKGAMIPRLPLGCIPFADLYRHISASTPLLEEQQQHLTSCGWCRTLFERMERALAQRRVAVTQPGKEILRLVSEVPEMLDEVLAAAKAVLRLVTRSDAIINLPLFEAPGAAPRMAAATGEGYSEQVLQQDEPPFEFRLTQFGEQLRVTVRALGPSSPYEECLARLRLFEGDACRFTRHILIREGEGRCIIEPDVARAIRPRKGALRIEIEPVLTLDHLAAAGTEAYLPILERLLKHEDPRIRRHTVEVLSLIRGPEAAPLVESLANDADETVRAAVRRVLDSTEPRHE